MRAAAFTSPGVVEIIELPVPEPGAGEVRIRVRTAGVQPVDLAVGGGYTMPGVPDVWPRVVGNEVAGTIDATGPGVTGFEPGDEVLAFSRLNCYQEYTLVPADQVMPKPKTMPWEIAGVFPAAIMTPHIALTELGVGPGMTVLIHAAAGGVGPAGVQLARAWGATVIGTASEANHDYLRSLGALPVAYGQGWWSGSARWLPRVWTPWSTARAARRSPAPSNSSTTPPGSSRWSSTPRPPGSACGPPR
ncbi:hypothetical protein GCM10010468_35350 [Actinocorallia longicatena]|uniref:Enoyl reductase (ER) domain-containing protein n=1 Tax=Actinocorallia longicatena TaxID=111803 RepID=A0ABP6QAX4_9ACTN